MNKRSENLRQYRHDATAQFLLEAAEAVMAENGYDRVTMREIATRAGCAPGTFYLYFKNKQEVLGALTARHSHLLLTQLNGILAGPAAPEVKLQQIIQTLVLHFTRNQGIIRVLYAGQTMTPGSRFAGMPAPIRREWHAFFRAELLVIKAAQEAGSVRTDYSPVMIQSYMNLVVLGLRDEILAQTRLPSLAKLQRMVWQMLREGIGKVESCQHE